MDIDYDDFGYDFWKNKSDNDYSVWYPIYNELISGFSRYDISKKKKFHVDFHFIEEKEINIDEMKKRYLFLAENSLFLLAPLLREKHNISGQSCVEFKNDIYLLVLLEKYLFSDTKVEESELYKNVLEFKNNPFYIDIYNRGIDLNKKFEIDLSNIDTAMFLILESVRSYIEGQPKCFNKYRKLCVLDEYFRVLRYSNDGKVWTSGYIFDGTDLLNNVDSHSINRFDKISLPSINVLSDGEGYSKFLSGFRVRRNFRDKTYSCNGLSEEDKKDIYLKLHDELAWDLEIKCEMEEPELRTMIDSRLIRPDNTSPCDFSFRISEGNIFVYGRNFYHLCSNCGFIVKVDNSLLSEGIQKRIRERCSNDKNLFRKMELISELHALDSKSLPQHKVLFKSKD